MELCLVWLVVGIVPVIAEPLTGTFYLPFFGIAALIGSAVAYLGAPIWSQAIVSEALAGPGGMDAANLKIAEEYIGAFANVAKTGNTLILPSNLSDVAALVGTAMTVLYRTRGGGAARAPSA